GNIGESGEDRAAEDLLAGLAGIDRKDRVTLVDQVFRDEKARPHVIGRGTDDGDRLHGIQDAGDIGIVVGIVVHSGSEIRPSASKGKSGLCATSQRLPSVSSK